MCFFRSRRFIRVNLFRVFLLRLLSAILGFVIMAETHNAAYDSKIEGNVIFQLGSQEFALADADGIGLLRD